MNLVQYYEGYIEANQLIGQTIRKASSLWQVFCHNGAGFSNGWEG